MENQPIGPSDTFSKLEKGSRHGAYFFYICLALSLVVMFLLWRPFITTLFLSIIFAFILYPLYLRLLKAFKDHCSAASLVTCFLLILLFIVPISILFLFLVQEAIGFYESLASQGGLEVPPPIERLLDYLKAYLPGFIPDLRSQAMGILKTVAQFIISHSQIVIGNIATSVLHFFVLIFALYYLLCRGAEWLKNLSEIIPLPDRQKMLIVSTFNDVSKTTILGMLATSVLQGVVAAIGFWISGISPILWGTAVAFASLIPVIGSGLVWLPAAVVLLAVGKIWNGIFLLIWGVVIVGSVDNFARPYLMKGKGTVNALWILLSILGGIQLFGFSGILVGPMLLSITVTLIMIYKEAYATEDTICETPTPSAAANEESSK